MLYRFNRNSNVNSQYFVSANKHGFYKKLRDIIKGNAHVIFEVGCTGDAHNIGTNNGNYLEKTSVDFNGHNNVVMCNYNSSVGDMTSWDDFPEYNEHISSLKKKVKLLKDLFTEEEKFYKENY